MGYVTNNHIWNGERDFERYVDLDRFYSMIKNRFIKQGTYHWSVKEFDVFVEKNNFNYDNCVTVLKDYCELYGEKFKISNGLIRFVSVLKERKLKKELKKRIGIKIEHDNKEGRREFIVEYTNFLLERTDLKRGEIFTKIYNEFAIGYAKDTIPDIYRNYNGK